MGRKQSPILNNNKLKLGFFSPNCSGGMSVTKVPERWVNSWDNNIRLAQLADEAGIEFLLPIARWIGYGGGNDIPPTPVGRRLVAQWLGAHPQKDKLPSERHTPRPLPVVSPPHTSPPAPLS